MTFFYLVCQWWPWEEHQDFFADCCSKQYDLVLVFLGVKHGYRQGYRHAFQAGQHDFGCRRRMSGGSRCRLFDGQCRIRGLYGRYVLLQSLLLKHYLTLLFSASPETVLQVRELLLYYSMSGWPLMWIIRKGCWNWNWWNTLLMLMLHKTWCHLRT